MSKQTGTARAMEAASTKPADYTIGSGTKKHLTAFVTGLKGSAKASVVCLQEALAVAQDFPRWEKGSEAYKALAKETTALLKASGMKEGSAKGYAQHFSNIVRCAQLPEVKYAIGQRKDKTYITRTTTGKAYFETFGNFADAYHAAKVIAKQYGLTNGGRGRKTGTTKPLDKGQIIDALDKIIASVRVTQGFDATLLPLLTRARDVAHGWTKAKAKKAENQTARLNAMVARQAAMTKAGKGVNVPVLH